MCFRIGISETASCIVSAQLDIISTICDKIIIVPAHDEVDMCEASLVSPREYESPRGVNMLDSRAAKPPSTVPMRRSGRQISSHQKWQAAQ